MKSKLILENGLVFEGNAFGYLEDSIGEVVFNTGMTGYQEILTDPSYYNQIVLMTYPLIGNYGINLEDVESKGPKVKGFIVREKSDYPNNWRSEFKLDVYLKHNKIIGLEGIDTRALTKIIRNSGTMKGIITLKEITHSELEQRFEEFNNQDAVMQVTTKKGYEIEGSGNHVVIMDFGIKENIIRSFKKRDCKMTVLPAYTKAEEILKISPDLVFLSNGPGDPKDLTEIIDTIKELVGNIPIAGICLGHQLLALSLDGNTAKLKFGHRGCNHPVMDLEKNRVYITSQNHGYFVNDLPQNMNITHISMNDETIEGMKHKTLPIYSVQFHPEANPGPTDADHIFDEFLQLCR